MKLIFTKDQDKISKSMDICTYVWFVFKLQSGQQFKQRDNSSHNRDASTAMSRKSCMSMPHSKDINTYEILDERLSSSGLFKKECFEVTSSNSVYMVWQKPFYLPCMWPTEVRKESQCSRKSRGPGRRKPKHPPDSINFPQLSGTITPSILWKQTGVDTHTHATTVLGWRLPVRYERLVLGACPDPGTSKSVTIRDFYADDFIQTTDQIF